jgi:hypothetical protein
MRTLLILLLAAPVFADEIFVQIRIDQQTEVGRFKDALYYPVEQWNSVDPASVEAERQARIEKWVDQIKNPPPTPDPVEPTKEELQAQADAIAAEIAARQAELQKIIEEIDKKDADVVGEIEVIP